MGRLRGTHRVILKKMAGDLLRSPLYLFQLFVPLGAGGHGLRRGDPRYGLPPGGPGAPNP